MANLMRKPLTVVCALAVLSPALAAQTQTQDAAKILAQTSAGVGALTVYGENKQELARGSVLSLGEGVVVAPYHLLSRGVEAEVANAKGKKIKVEGFVTVEKGIDVAVLRLKGKLDPLLVGSIQNLPEGGRIFAVGADDISQITVSEGTARRPLSLPGQRVIREVSLSATPGFNGAPVFDLSGAMVGMLVFMDRGARFLLPADLFSGLAKAGKVTDLKSWPKEDYFDTLDGAWLAGSVGAAMDDAALARTALEKVVRLDPARVEAQELLAATLLKSRDYPGAVDAYRKVIASDPNKAGAQYGLGQVLMRMGRHAEAVPALQKAIELGIPAKEAPLELATALEESKDFAKASDAYVKYLAGKPENPASAWLRLGLCRTELGQFPEAIAALQEALKLQPQDIKTNLSMAETYEKAGQLEQAEASYDALVKINPQDSKTYYSRALMMYDAKGRYDKALAVAKKVMDVNPQDTMALYNVGVLQHKVQAYGDAVVTLKKVLDANPNNVNAWYYYGFSYYNQKKYPEAIQAFTKYTSLSPEDAKGWLLIGVSHMFLKDYEAALSPLQKCVELNPNDSSAQFNLGVAYVYLRDNYSAREVLKKLQGIDSALAERLRKIIR